MTRAVEVDNVQVLMLLTSPGLVRITVEGRKIEGVPVDVKQERKGTEIVVTITQTYPGTVPVRQVPLKESIGLEGPLPQGRYTLRVNTFTTTFDM